MIEDLWYKNAVVYCVDVDSFMDGNGDGVGDFTGLEHRLDYLAGLGITCLWLLPFQPTPDRDNGYDVSDYYAVDPRLGDAGDFVAFTHQAALRGIRIIIDLVANHTSRRHPWFQAARRDPKSRFRDFYLWSKKRPRDMHQGMVFPGQQESTWTYDARARAYYFHRFFDFQPDLNISNPEVRREILKVMGYWLELGVSGFRVDAVPFLIEQVGPEERGAAYEFLDQMRDFLSWRRGDAVLLAEANVPLHTAQDYFGAGGRMHLVFNFLANQHLFLSLATQDARPLARMLGRGPALDYTSQWAHFLRNHDELDLGRLSAAQRRRVFAELGPEEEMQLFGRGLRRRLAPMLGGERARLELAYSLMFSLPGTPVLWYGEELGMGEDLRQKGRDAVRTPMQWSHGRHGGFTRARRPVRPLVSSGRYSYRRVNVDAQRRDPNSLLNWMERMVRMRKECPELGWGRCRVLPVERPAVLALQYDWRGSGMVVLHNLSPAPCRLTLQPQGEAPAELVNVLSEQHSVPDEQGRHHLELERYGYRWYRVGRPEPGAPPRAHVG